VPFLRTAASDRDGVAAVVEHVEYAGIAAANVEHDSKLRLRVGIACRCGVRSKMQRRPSRFNDVAESCILYLRVIVRSSWVILVGHVVVAFDQSVRSAGLR
jgi:ABC-type thiamine transport system ATPase subunit